ncbi:toll/interleukin-1 receptor domain-containing protein [Micromonospora orduensis]|uniref:Toll/interleukin-1 receptor domain-containing protein n=1 Tax=Micromonospora orduensis TaxID=1420891 RepID=A0A5C4QZ03_9ACTN|nr:TIR domain-containing protein [Micromonospora orduensis]TNH31328.1 toll/interleukin-1 receptor domain-containing protein [Micromonospora orduensis]
MTGVFINYRTGDGQDMAVLLNERLRDVFGKERVFLDSTGLPAGQQFPPELKRRLRDARVLLVLIGRQWLDLEDSEGNRRIANRKDYVRYEIRKSIKWQKVVLPVLLDGASLPKAQDLPSDIAGLSDFQYRHLRSREADNDLAEIVAVLRNQIPVRQRPSQDTSTSNIATTHRGPAAAGANAKAIHYDNDPGPLGKRPPRPWEDE